MVAIDKAMASGPDGPIDLLVVGGGINGAGIACDAAGRGLSVLLCEQGDLAQVTSSASSKLIHGGLRYLEHYDFALVREALAERRVLLAKAPHIVHPLRFVLPHRRGLRRRWLIRAGLMLYDGLAGRGGLGGSHAIDLGADPAGRPLKPFINRGFVYHDCGVDDSWLVVFNALAAAERGATVMTRTRLASARRADGRWLAHIEDTATGGTCDIRAHAIVNAAGPWAERVRDMALPAEADDGKPRHHLRLVKDSHLVVPRLYAGDHAYILQNTDGQVVFVLPFEGAFSLIGTTDVAIDGDPAEIRMDDDEAAYLCAAVNDYFAAAVEPADAVWSYTGVRALVDNGATDPSAVTREYALELDGGDGAAPLLSVFGGKITTYRRLAEQALAALAPHLPGMGKPWTRSAPLPGGDIGTHGFEWFVHHLALAYPALDQAYLCRLAGRHGSRARAVLGDTRAPRDLGRDFGGGLHAREVDYLIAHEWALTAEDILWRRTKCGLHMTESERTALDTYLADRAQPLAAPSTRSG